MCFLSDVVNYFFVKAVFSSFNFRYAKRNDEEIFDFFDPAFFRSKFNAPHRSRRDVKRSHCLDSRIALQRCGAAATGRSEDGRSTTVKEILVQSNFDRSCLLGIFAAIVASEVFVFRKRYYLSSDKTFLCDPKASRSVGPSGPGAASS